VDNFNIESDLTLKNTKLVLDGKDVTKKSKVVGISFYATSPVKDSDDVGWIDLSVTTVDDKGTAETKTYRKSEYLKNKLPMGQVIKDMIDEKGADSVVRFIGHEADQEIKEVADKIAEHCKDKKLKCPDVEVLYARTLDSLKDKAEDIGLDLDSE